MFRTGIAMVFTSNDDVKGVSVIDKKSSFVPTMGPFDIYVHKH